MGRSSGRFSLKLSQWEITDLILEAGDNGVTRAQRIIFQNNLDAQATRGICSLYK